MSIANVSPELAERLKRLQHLVLDMDGTIYLGSQLFTWTMPFLRLLDQLAITYTFITNNCSQSAREYVEKLNGLGIAAQQDAVFTSAQATIEHLRHHAKSVRRVYILGTASLKQEFGEAGLEVVGLDVADEPDAVIVGFDTSLDYASLCRAAWWIQQGKLYLATHPDRVCPTNLATVLPDCGVLCACLQQATGRVPDAILGKPSPRMIEGVLQRRGLTADQVAVVGDRLYTDIVMAHQSARWACSCSPASRRQTMCVARTSSRIWSYEILRSLAAC